MFPTEPQRAEIEGVDHIDSAVTTVTKGSNASRTAVLAVVAAMAVGGAFAAWLALRGPDGPASTEAAISQFFDAIDNEDYVAMLATIHPAERESIGGPLLKTFGHMQRLGLLAEDFDPSGSGGFDTDVEGLTYSVERVALGLDYVTTTGGTITTTDSTSLPLGPALTPFQEYLDEPAEEVETTDLADDPLEIAVVEYENSWYLSLWYSAAESARRDSGEGFLGLGRGPEPVGAESADAVLEALIGSLVHLDPTGVLTLIDPTEMAALYDYSPLFLDDVESGANELRGQLDDEGVVLDLVDVDYDSSELNGRTIVNLRSMQLAVTWSEGSATVTIRDGCTTAEASGTGPNGEPLAERFDSCEEADTGDGAEVEVRRLWDEALTVLDVSDATRSIADSLRSVDTGVTVVERDGRWFLAVMPSMLEPINDYLAALEPEQVEAASLDIQQMIDDKDRIGEELMALLETADFDALFGSTAAFGDPFGAATGTGIDEFSLPDPDGADGGFPGDDIGVLEGRLAPAVADYWTIERDFLYLAWEGNIEAAPPLDVAVTAFDQNFDGSIEIAAFAGPVDPVTVLGTEGWDVETRADGTIVYVDIDGWNRFAFVGPFVVWGDGTSAESMALFEAQVATFAGA